MTEICDFFAEGSLYIRHIVAADAFPCAVVEEEEYKNFPIQASFSAK